MTEQERGKESPVQFPRVSKEVVERLLQDLEEQGGGMIMATGDRMANEDIVLNLFLDKCVEKFGAGLFVGADFVYTAFKKLEKNGVILPKVSWDTIKTYFAEASSADLVYEILEREDLTPDEKLAEFRKLKASVEFNFPTPFEYCEENPALMVVITDKDYTSPFGYGAMLTYELKRRQFHADQLAKQFGG